jgi:hypothetical protein
MEHGATPSVLTLFQRVQSSLYCSVLLEFGLPASRILAYSAVATEFTHDLHHAARVVEVPSVSEKINGNICWG